MFITSNHAHNTGMAKFISDKLYNYDTTDEKTMNPMKWWSLQNGGKITDTRETINGFPCRLILVNDGTTTLNEGQAEPTPGNTKDMGIFNFNNDKDNLNTMGMDTDIFPNCISYEVTANSDTSAGAFVPYKAESYIYITYKEEPYVGDPNISMNPTARLPISVIGASAGDTMVFEPIDCSRENIHFQFYNNDTYLWMAEGITSVNIPDSATHIVLQLGTRWKGGVPMETGDSFYLNGVKFVVGEAVETPTYEIKGGSEAEELEYLQNSFELRYPDADDVGGDYGYLGLPRPEYFIYEKGGTQWISIEHLGTRDLLIEYDLQQTDIENFGNLQLLHSDGSTTIHYTQRSGSFRTFEERVTHFRFYGQPMNVLEYIKFNGVVYWMDRNTTIEGNKIKDDPIKKDRIDSNYGLKRVIDWVGNCTDEEFVADFDKYFNRHYTLRYYLLVVLMAGVDNLG